MSIAVEDRRERRCDVLVVGAGAAGLFAALAARGALDPDAGEGLPTGHAPDVVLLNNEARLGLKILVSGGGRCNLTNVQVDEKDYESDAPRAVKGLLCGFPAAAVRTFFRAPPTPSLWGKSFRRAIARRTCSARYWVRLRRRGFRLSLPPRSLDWIRRFWRVNAGWFAWGMVRNGNLNA